MITSESPDMETFIFSLWVHLEGIWVKFICEGHWVEVKVTGKNPEIPIPAM